MTDVVGIIFSDIDIGLTLVIWLLDTFKNIDHNTKAIERLLQRYKVVGDKLRQLKPHRVAWSSSLRENITQVHEYFCDARHTLERMKSTTVSGHRSLRAVWKANRFADEILRLSARLDVAENKLLHLSTLPGQSSGIADVQCDVQSPKAFSKHLRLELREQIMVQFCECIREEPPKSLEDVNKLESKAVQKAVLSSGVQSAAGNEGVDVVMDDEALERRILSWDKRVEQLRQKQCDIDGDGPASLEVSRFAEDLHQPWHLHPTADVQIAQDEGMFGNQTKIIGTGSTSVVYAGSVKNYSVSDQPFRPAAVKVLNKAVTGSSWKSDFLREVEMMSDLDHPCIVEFLGAYWPESSEKHHEPFVALELMTHNIMQRELRVLNEDSITKIMLDVAEGLEYLHDLGVVHMDVKPRNILVRIDENGSVIGRAKISDFGVSCKKRFHSSRQCAVSTKAVGGTMAYMAPELRQDSSGKARPSCDTWSFGMTMLHMLQMERFGNSNSGMTEEEYAAGLQKMILNESVESLAGKIGNERLRSLTLKCLQSDQELRPSMSDVRLDLLCADVGVRPNIARNFVGKTADVLYSDGIAKFFGLGTARNPVIAWEMLSVASRLEHTDSAFALHHCFSNDRYERKAEGIFYLLGIDESNPSGLTLLGICVLLGFGTEKYEPWAISRFERAAEAGDARAQCNLGLCYENGTGVKKNIAKAVSLYQQAADAGYATAQCRLGQCYEYGRRVEKNVAKAVSLYQQAADAGDATAQCNLGVCYKNGTGVKKNIAKAVSLLQQAADVGDARAQCNLGLCYKNGTGVKKNIAKAVSLLQQAADVGDARAQCNLGLCYENRAGVEKNNARAMSLYQQAAEAGYATAQWLLGNRRWQ